LNCRLLFYYNMIVMILKLLPDTTGVSRDKALGAVTETATDAD
jgi:hypothetical protein